MSGTFGYFAPYTDRGKWQPNCKGRFQCNQRKGREQVVLIIGVNCSGDLATSKLKPSPKSKACHQSTRKPGMAPPSNLDDFNPETCFGMMNKELIYADALIKSLQSIRESDPRNFTSNTNYKSLIQLTNERNEHSLVSLLKRLEKRLPEEYKVMGNTQVSMSSPSSRRN